MDDYFLSVSARVARVLGLHNFRSRLKGVRITTKQILIIVNLVVITGLFFSVHFRAQAQVYETEKAAAVDNATVDPLNRIGKETVRLAEVPKNISSVKTARPEINKMKDERETRYREMVKGHPIEEMAEEISKRDEKTAAFLIAIARKESSWGLHAPSKNGRDCFNYWGYKGSYKLNMGYSCFDSREQAIEIVGDKIKSLIDKKIDTPERMLVWKCGSTCKGHDPSGVRKWVSDVSGIFYKLNS